MSFPSRLVSLLLNKGFVMLLFVSVTSTAQQTYRGAISAFGSSKVIDEMYVQQIVGQSSSTSNRQGYIKSRPIQVPNIFLQRELSLQPNPVKYFTGVIGIEPEDKFNIYNSEGTKVLSGVSTSRVWHRIDTSKLSAGQYILLATGKYQYLPLMIIKIQ